MRNPILTIVGGLLVVIAVQVAGTASAASTSGASWSATKTAVRIHLKGTVPQMAALGRGRFTLSGTTYKRTGRIFTPAGAISDRGIFVDRCHRGCFQDQRPSSYVRTLRGARGTIWVTGDRKGHWKITNATRAYAGLRGRGRERGLYSSTIDMTMTGTLSR
jgi:hypothetical protein